MTGTQYQPLVELTRGKITESVHYGAIAVVNTNNDLLANFGDPEMVAFLRSSAKPFQAIPVFEYGAIDEYGFTDKEIALICSSHSSTDEHLAAITELQDKIGLLEENLMCGTHPPMDKQTEIAMLLRGEEPTQRRHNCSGKHTGMLAQAKIRRVPLENYIDIHHPVQQADLKVFSEMCAVAMDQVEIGIDGCSVPVYAIPLRNAALGFARLADPVGLPENRAAACRRITKAMTAYPFMVAGPDRFDTALMEAFEGKIVTKTGAEGFQAIGILPGVLSPGSPGVGIAIKISDGDLKDRARPTASLEVLRQLGINFTTRQKEILEKFDCPPVKNWRKIVVGETRPVFTLQKTSRG